LPQATVLMHSQQISKSHRPNVVYIEYLYHAIENTANQNTGSPLTLYI